MRMHKIPQKNKILPGISIFRPFNKRGFVSQGSTFFNGSLPPCSFGVIYVSGKAGQVWVYVSSSHHLHQEGAARRFDVAAAAAAAVAAAVASAAATGAGAVAGADAGAGAGAAASAAAAAVVYEL